MHAEPLSPSDAQRLIRIIVAEGEVIFTRHCLDELENDGCGTNEAKQVLRRGIVREPAEFHLRAAEWRYRVEGFEPDGKYLVLVITFVRSNRAVAITAFEKRQLSRKTGDRS